MTTWGDHEAGAGCQAAPEAGRRQAASSNHPEQLQL